jgi:multiple sugar transport system substrate-binding protein
MFMIRTRIRRRLATVVALCAVAVAACSGGGNQGGLAGGAAGGNEGGGGDTLVVPTSQAPWNPAYAEVVDHCEEQTGLTVDLREFPNDEVKTTQVNDIQSGQNTFDIYQINEQDVAQFMSNEWVRPFTEIDPEYQLDDAVFTYDNMPYWNAEDQVFDEDGTLTSVPLVGNLEIFMYRTDIYDALDLEVPKTWDDIIANGRAAQESGDVEYGGAFRLQGIPGTAAISYDFQAIYLAQGATWFADPGTDWTPTVATSEAIEAARILRDLAELGPSATTTMGQAEAIATMQAGDAAETYLVAAAAAQLEDPASSNVAGKIGYATLPEQPTGGPATATGLWTLAVPAGLSEARSANALAFIDCAVSQEAQTVFAEAGGVPIRSDYDDSGLGEAAKAALSVTRESASNAAGMFRYAFAPDMLNVTEPILADIAAGDVSPEEGMQQMQREFEQIVEANDLPAG